MNYPLTIIFSLSLPENNELRMQLGAANTLEIFRNIVDEIKDTYLPYHEGKIKWDQTVEEGCFDLVLPPWLCQPYVRLPPEEHLKKVEDHRNKFDKQVN